MVNVEIDEGSGFCFGVTTAIKKAEEVNELSWASAGNAPISIAPATARKRFNLFVILIFIIE